VSDYSRVMDLKTRDVLFTVWVLDDEWRSLCKPSKAIWYFHLVYHFKNPRGRVKFYVAADVKAHAHAHAHARTHTQTHRHITFRPLPQHNLTFYTRQHFQYSITSDCKSYGSSQTGQIEETALSDIVKPFWYLLFVSAAAKSIAPDRSFSVLSKY